MKHYGYTGFNQILCGADNPKEACTDKEMVTCPKCRGLFRILPPGQALNCSDIGINGRNVVHLEAEIERMQKQIQLIQDGVFEFDVEDNVAIVFQGRQGFARGCMSGRFEAAFRRYEADEVPLNMRPLAEGCCQKCAAPIGERHSALCQFGFVQEPAACRRAGDSIENQHLDNDYRDRLIEALKNGAWAVGPTDEEQDAWDELAAPRVKPDPWELIRDDWLLVNSYVTALGDEEVINAFSAKDMLKSMTAIKDALCGDHKLDEEKV